MKLLSGICIMFLLAAAFSCTKKTEFQAHFDNTHDRIWVGKDFWSIPLEDWKVEDGNLLKDYRDAGWSYCTPAICNFYMRWYLPDELDIPVLNRPDHGYPNTGNYEDSFGNLSYVYAVGNPGKIVQDNNSRYNNAQIRASGFGMITFDQAERSIDIDAWRFIADVENPNMVRDQFAGWPLTISQFDNLGMGAENVLPEISINKSNQLLQIWNERTGELEQVFRIQGSSVQPRLHNDGSFRITIGEGNNKKEYSGFKTKHGSNDETVSVEL